MADDGSSNAGYLSLEFRASIEALQSAFEQAEFSLDSFTATVQDSAIKIESGGQQITSTFENIQLGSLRTEERFTRIAAQMLIAQVAMQSLSSNGKSAFSDLGVAVDAGAMGLERFVMIFGAFPSTTSAVLGGVAALAAGYNVFTKAIDEVTKAQDKLNASLAKNLLKVQTSVAKEESRTEVMPGAQGDIQKSIDDQTKTLERANLWIEQFNTDVSKAANDIPLLDQKIQQLQNDVKAFNERNAVTGGGDPLANQYQLAPLLQQIQALVRQKMDIQDTIENLRKGLAGIGIDATSSDAGLQNLVKNIQNLKEALKLVSGTDGLQKIQDQLSAVGQLGRSEVTLGLITPLQATQKDLQAVQSAMEQILKMQIALQQAAALLPADDPTAQKLLAQSNQLGTTLGALQSRGQMDKTLIGDDQQIQQFSQQWGSAMSSAFTNAILNGQNALQTLKAFGTDIFRDMMKDVTKQFQDGMTAAFNALGAPGGAALGGLLTGIVGILGGIFGSKSSSSQSYAGVTPVTSTEVVRGIVAGPTNVAIADLQGDLATALIPTNTILQSILNALSSPRAGGPQSLSSSGPIPVAGTVPAS